MLTATALCAYSVADVPHYSCTRRTSFPADFNGRHSSDIPKRYTGARDITFARSARNNWIPKRDGYIHTYIQTISEIRRRISCLALRRSAISVASLLARGSGLLDYIISPESLLRSLFLHYPARNSSPSQKACKLIQRLLGISFSSYLLLFLFFPLSTSTASTKLHVF